MQKIQELSIFVDESGGQDGHSNYILVTLILHNQSDSISHTIQAYEDTLRINNIPNIPFHMSPLINGHKDYVNLPLSKRKKLLSAFEALCRKLPFTYKTFTYKRSKIHTNNDFKIKFKRDLVIFLTDNLVQFQKYQTVKIYYDNGQQMVTQALHAAIDFTLSKQAVLYKMANAKEYRMFQVADFVCGLELTDIKYKTKSLTNTDIKVFGASYQKFKTNHLRKIRRKVLT